ncbi:MAG TPA: hypothetical protein VIR54_26830 [Vicinamibacterales bacterium]
MTFVRILIIALAVIEAGWMTFDGTRALVVGDYVTPRNGPHAGQLGPWHRVVGAAGVAPRSTLMKSIFVAYGVSWLIAVSGFICAASWAWAAMMIAAVGSLWYLPMGTICSVIQIISLISLRRTG